MAACDSVDTRPDVLEDNWEQAVREELVGDFGRKSRDNLLRQHEEMVRPRLLRRSVPSLVVALERPAHPNECFERRFGSSSHLIFKRRFEQDVDETPPRGIYLGSEGRKLETDEEESARKREDMRPRRRVARGGRGNEDSGEGGR